MFLHDVALILTLLDFKGEKSKMVTLVQWQCRINARCSEGFLALKRLEPTMLKSMIFASANFLSELFLGLLYPYFPAFVEAFFIGPPLRGFHREHARRISIGEHGTDKPLGDPFFNDWVSLSDGLPVNGLDLP